MRLQDPLTMDHSRTDDSAWQRERWNTVFRALSAEPRRQVVAALMAEPAQSHLPLPAGANPAALSQDPDALYRDLIHSHLPTLENAGLIEWQREPLSARRGPQFEQAATVLDVLATHSNELTESLCGECPFVETIREHDE